MFNFLKKNICSNFVALLVAFIFIISYSMCMHFLVLEIKPSQFNNLTFAFYKMTIMTENNVHFLAENDLGHFNTARFWLGPSLD